MVVIKDNLLEKKDLANIQNTVLSPDFPWFLNNVLSFPHNEKDLDNIQFIHAFHHSHSIRSNYVDIILPIINKINPKSLIRIKANIMPRRESIVEHGYHVDFDFPCKTAVFYINTNNGYTKFESGEVVESVENRLVIFDSQNAHTGTSTTDSQYRAVINFNYFD